MSMSRSKTNSDKRQVRRGPSGKIVVFLGAMATVAGTGLFFVLPTFHEVVYDPRDPRAIKDDGVVAVEPVAELEPVVATTTEARPTATNTPNYVPIPESVRAIYMTQCVVGTPWFRSELVDLIEETELNSVIIDIKDYTGKLAFTTDHPDLRDSVSDKCGARDMKGFIATLHEKGIFVIGRITVFQDPYYANKHPELAVKFADPPGMVWRDHKGLAFIDVGAKPFWDYILTISKEAHALGFDELNYDYVRYPSDGPMSNIKYEWSGDRVKAEMLEEFFVYLSKEMRNPNNYPVGVKPPIISADLFGMVTTNYDDLNIGQVLERAMPYFDYIAPMVYPSHYPRGFNGWENPNTVPYELIHFVLSSGVRRAVADRTRVPHFGGEPIMETVIVPPVATGTPTTTKEVFTGYYTKEVYDPNIIRPWLQDFNYGGTYGPAEVRAQIQATYDAGLHSWMLWAPSNRYTREALLGP